MIGALLRVRQRISTLLLVILTSIAALVLIGLVIMTLRLVAIQDDLGALRDGALPRMVKLSQLSQEAAATISIAPALSAKPSRFEFETLLSRIKDKETSQKALIGELEALIHDEDAARVLRNNADLLMANLQSLTDVVRQQIEVRKSLEKRIEYLRGLARRLSPQAGPDAAPVAGEAVRAAATNVHRILSMLLDPNSARLSRNSSEIEDGMQRMTEIMTGSAAADAGTGGSPSASGELVDYWSSNRERILEDKRAELSNEFKVKALVEENSLIANRLLGGANNEFWRASGDLDTQIQLVGKTTRFTLIAMAVVVAAFGAGNFFVWIVLRRRVFERLDRMRDAIRDFADNRSTSPVDPIDDEIGEISGSLSRYMSVIDQRETELQQLSSQLAKYLSPQVYDSIFRGEREVKVASTRKKLTVFFSDIAGFTETADRLESEQLTELLNHYLTEMSQIALDHGATIDKYVGDAILIFFGDPETRGVREDALACVRMAIAMRQRMHELAYVWRESGIERPLRVRMGIHTDYCTVGNFGSETRMDYTIIGGAVNTASRLESLADPGEILISYETFAQVRDQILCEEHGETRVKGIAYPVATYRVVDSYETARQLQRRFREEHPNVKVDLNFGAMTVDEREKAKAILHRAIGLLSRTRVAGSRNTAGTKRGKR